MISMCLKARRVLADIENFDVHFRLKFGDLLLGAAEEMPKVLQANNTSMQKAVLAANFACDFYSCQRQEETFDRNYDSVVMQAECWCIGDQ